MHSVMDCENPRLYKPDGLHPVHIGDRFSDDRYEVVHKLGHGSRSTIWLVHDSQTNTYVALKIIAAWKTKKMTELAVLQHLQATYEPDDEGSKHVVRMLDHFVHDGPNGQHQCIVTEAMGPSLAEDIYWIWESLHLPVQIAQRVTGQLALAVQYLHARGVAHGDLYPANILYCLPTTWFSHADMQYDLGEPELNEYGAPEDSPHAPQYLVSGLSANVDLLASCLRRASVKIADFSEASLQGMPDPPILATPKLYRPPDGILLNEQHPDAHKDMWALANVIFGLFAEQGSTLFRGLNDEAILYSMTRKLGKLPEPCWSLWDTRREFFDDDGMPLDPRVSTVLIPPGQLDVPPGGPEDAAGLEALLRSMLYFDPRLAITAKQLLESDWVRRYCRPFMADELAFDVEFGCDEETLDDWEENWEEEEEEAVYVEDLWLEEGDQVEDNNTSGKSSARNQSRPTPLPIFSSPVNETKDGD
ncbi:Protein kinase [Mycena chlorophos]|uniref:Protein kinase n=1 Tax=Mycena chlorophos TaxID=658473 RepID=A0A8H6WFX1_MYCCL|nr:Protein kinase [Mycena chlorophos]